MKVIGITFMIIGAIFGILHAINKNEFGMLSAGLAFMSGIAILLAIRGEQK